MAAPEQNETNGPTGAPTEELRSFVERVERLEVEKRAVQEDIKSVLDEATVYGLDKKTIKKIVALRRKSQSEIDNEQALLDIYKAALGMLGDTPLGGAALKKLQKKPAPAPGAPGEGSAAPEPTPEPQPEEAPLTAAAIEEARAQGADAAAHAKPVIANPWPAHDPRRAAWDEGWCAQSGSDGMEIPEAWKRPKKEKKTGETGAPAPAGEGASE